MGSRTSASGELAVAIADLEWFFGAKDAALGEHAQSYDPDRIVVAYNPSLAQEANVAETRRADIARSGRIEIALKRFRIEIRATLALAFTPCAWRDPRPLAEIRIPKGKVHDEKSGIWKAFRVRWSLKSNESSLAGVAATTDLARDAYVAAALVRAKKRGEVDPEPDVPEFGKVFAFLAAAAGPEGTGKQSLIRSIKDEAKRSVLECVAAYDAVRLERPDRIAS